jgi:hypothetical protein
MPHETHKRRLLQVWHGLDEALRRRAQAAHAHGRARPMHQRSGTVHRHMHSRPQCGARRQPAKVQNCIQNTDIFSAPNLPCIRCQPWRTASRRLPNPRIDSESQMSCRQTSQRASCAAARVLAPQAFAAKPTENRAQPPAHAGWLLARQRPAVPIRCRTASCKVPC